MLQRSIETAERFKIRRRCSYCWLTWKSKRISSIDAYSTLRSRKTIHNRYIKFWHRVIFYIACAASRLHTGIFFSRSFKQIHEMSQRALWLIFRGIQSTEETGVGHSTGILVGGFGRLNETLTLLKKKIYIFCYLIWEKVLSILTL